MFRLTDSKRDISPDAKVLAQLLEVTLGCSGTKSCGLSYRVTCVVNNCERGQSNSQLKQRSACPSLAANSCLMSHSAVPFALFDLTVSPLGQKYYPI